MTKSWTASHVLAVVVMLLCGTSTTNRIRLKMIRFKAWNPCPTSSFLPLYIFQRGQPLFSKRKDCPEVLVCVAVRGLTDQMGPPRTSYQPLGEVQPATKMRILVPFIGPQRAFTFLCSKQVVLICSPFFVASVVAWRNRTKESRERRDLPVSLINWQREPPCSTAKRGLSPIHLRPQKTSPTSTW